MEKVRGRTLGPGRVDMVKVEATTEQDVRRHMVEDGLNPDNPLAGFRPLSAVAEVRHQAEMSQDAFAKALHVPVKTIRNWEQGRSRPDPAAQALLAIVADDPARAFKAIERRMRSISDHVDKSLKQYPKGIIQGTRAPQGGQDTARAVGDAVARDLDAVLKGL